MFACNAQFSMRWERQCAAPNGLPHAGPGEAPKGASPGLGGGAKSFFSVILCSQNVKISEYLLAMPSFQCIGGASVPPRCLAGRWAGRHAESRVAWPWRRRRSFFLCRVVFAKRKNLCMFACNAQFSMHRGRQCAAPNGLPDAGPGGAPNGASPGLAAGKYVKFLCRVVLPN